MAPKLTKKILEQLERLEMRVLLHHWYGVNPDDVLTIATAEGLVNALAEDPEKFVNGSIDGDFFKKLSSDLPEWLRQVQEYLKGNLDKAPVRAILATTTTLTADVKKTVTEVKTAKEEIMALKGTKFGSKPEQTPSAAPAVEKGPDVSGLVEKLEIIEERCERLETGLLFLVNTTIPDESNHMDSYDEFLAALESDK